MEYAEAQKQRAIDQHSLQAGQFAERYRDLSVDVYKSCFNYSRHRLDVWLERFLPSSGRGLRLLDVGCGTGHHMAALRQRGFEVAGVDGSDQMLEQARLNNPGSEIQHADVEELPFPSDSFDYIVCIEVLRYLPDYSRCLQEMARVLKPGGVCLTTAVPVLNLNGYWLINRVANLMPLGDLVRLKQFFTTSSRLHREFVQAGFDAPETHGIYLGPVNWIERLTPALLPQLLRKWEPVDAKLADQPVLREFSNLFLVNAVRCA